MTCGNLKKRRDKGYVIKLAGCHSKANEVDVQVFHETKLGFGKVFDYEEIKGNEGRSLVDKIIKFRPDKSKKVLRNPGQRKSKTTES